MRYSNTTGGMEVMGDLDIVEGEICSQVCSMVGWGVSFFFYLCLSRHGPAAAVSQCRYNSHPLGTMQISCHCKWA